MSESDTIAAIATPVGKSALAVIRVSGPQAIDITASCVKEKKRFIASDVRHSTIYTAIHPASGTTLDEVTAIKYIGPRSFTGENMVEICCHGGPLIVRRIAEALLLAGARTAMRGEFTRRALVNGKINLMRAEAIGGLIESSSEVELACAQKLYGGSSREILRWKECLVEILAKIEAQIEFSEEEHVSESGIEKTKLIDFIAEIEKDLKKRENIRRMEERVSIVIAGPANAGKSTLFNMLLGYGRAIVHEEPGTTRDLVRERIWINNRDVLLVDSAGLRDSDNPVEREGIARSRDAISDASIVVWVSAANEEVKEWEKDELRGLRKKRLICIINKIDQNDGNKKREVFKSENIDPFLVSLKNDASGEKILDAIARLNEDFHQAIELPDVFLNLRQEEIGKALLDELVRAKASWDRQEIAAHHLKNGILLLDEFVGRTENEEVLNRIFDKFCIGK